MLEQAVFAARREALAARIGDAVAVFAAMPVATRNSDVEHAYRQHSDLYYLTGFDEPESLLVLRCGAAAKAMWDGAGEEGGDVHATLFVAPRTARERSGTGSGMGRKAPSPTFEWTKLSPSPSWAPSCPSCSPALWCCITMSGPTREPTLGSSTRSVARGAWSVERGPPAPSEIISPRLHNHELRLRKSADEIALMRRANEISADAHHAAMRLAAPGRFEYEVEAELTRIFRSGGAERPAYDSIVGSGPNATCLHYRRNDRQLEQGDVLLIDAGCEYGYYASDITRTFPVGGTFSAAQRSVYEIVLAAQDASIAAVRPGATLADVHDASVRVLTQGMLDLGLLDAGLGLEEAIEEKKYSAFYMHRTSHWLGMDVHDVGRVHLEGAQRALEPGFALTVEPGMYIATDAEVDERYRGIGVRIEDDIVVTQDGHDNLTTVVKTADDVERVCQGG